jgi:DNA helicase-2/ATP-dependent DNA helicase PcrA
MADGAMTLTAEQAEAVKCNDHLMLTACPGSGKTRVIISKLARAIDEVRGSARAVGCITYTNAAVQEIESRLRHHIQPGDDGYFDICTIHSFCLTHIFRPFSFFIRGYESGFKVITVDNPDFEKHASSVSARHRKFDLTARDLDDFTQLRIDAGGNPVGNAIDNGGLTTEIANEYWESLRKDGYVDFANIIYYSLVLLREHPEILSYVASKFSWILVDEFQDTTDLQVELLALIATENRTRFLLVGDPYQSVFRFAGARPDLADSFAAEIGARTDLHLSGNFRSSALILEHANALFPREPTMIAVGPFSLTPHKPSWQHGESAFDVITDYFLPALEAREIPIGEAAILAPTWFPLFPLGRRLREYGVSIVGPGARPYRRNRQFAPLAEQVCGYIMEPRAEAISGLERTLFNTVLDLTGRSRFDIFSYSGRNVVFKLLRHARELQKAHAGATAWLDAAAPAFSQVLIDEGYLTKKEASLFTVSVEEMKADMVRNRVDLANLTIEDLGIYASPDGALKLSTLHNAKGREYRAVAMIDVHEGKIPFYQAQGDDDIAEAKRLFYVGVTRAKQYLLYVTDSSNARSVASRFLRAEHGVGIVP